MSTRKLMRIILIYSDDFPYHCIIVRSNFVYVKFAAQLYELDFADHVMLRGQILPERIFVLLLKVSILKYFT